MPAMLTQRVAQLGRLSVNELVTTYAEVFGEATNTRNKTWLIKRIAWRWQVMAHGGLSHVAQERANELANPADLRIIAPPDQATPAANLAAPLPPERDPRLPPPGTILTRTYKGRVLRVTVNASDFTYAGERYTSLSAVAKAITGSHCNGFLFFKLLEEA